MRRMFLAVIAVVALGCSGRVEKDDRPAFTIDRAQPFRLEFGRGSGMHGLDTVKLDQTGRVVLHRQRVEDEEGVIKPRWRTATIQLPPEGVSEVLDAVESNGLMRLHKAYHADIHDGTQWVFWVKQGEREKSVYFNNRFPDAITTFARQLDTIVGKAWSDKVQWQPAPEGWPGEHSRELWDSIQR